MRKPAYSAKTNWAHRALLQMDEANGLCTWASVSMPDVPRYYRSVKAFWDVVNLLAAERRRLAAKPSIQRRASQALTKKMRPRLSKGAVGLKFKRR